MNLAHVVTFLIGCIVANSAQRKTGEVVYTLEFQSSLKDCDDFENKILDMSNLQIHHESANDNSLNGTIVVNEDIGEEGITEVVVAAYKETGMGREFVYMVESDMCQNLNNKDMPWSPLFAVLEATRCPIQAKTYTVEKLKLNLDYAKHVMKHEFVGDYFATVALRRATGAAGAAGPSGMPGLSPQQQLSCHALQLAVVETKLDE